MTTMADDRIVAMMKAAGMTVDRENYIAVNWGNPKPDPWTPEHEDEIPEALQDWSWFTPNNSGVGEGEGTPPDEELLSKVSVGYEHPAQGPHQCGECQHFFAPEDCRLVESPISEEDWCKRFEAE